MNFGPFTALFEILIAFGASVVVVVTVGTIFLILKRRDVESRGFEVKLTTGETPVPREEKDAE